MGLPARAGFKKVRGFQKALKAVRKEAGQEVKITIYSESKIEVEILSVLQPRQADSKETVDGVFTAACRISDSEKRAAGIESADIVLVAVSPKMTSEQIARIVVGTSGARKRLVVVLDSEVDDAWIKRIAKVFNVDAGKIAFLPQIGNTEFAPMLVSKVTDSLKDKNIALGAAAPVFRGEVARRIITKASNQNAAIGFFVFIPGADMPLLTMNQVRMVLQLSALYRQDISLKRLYEILGVVAGGFVFRALAREFIALIPVLGWMIKGIIAYSGTIAMGRLTIKFLESRRNLELEAKPE